MAKKIEELEVDPTPVGATSGKAEVTKVDPLGKLATNDPFITALAAKLDEVIAHL